MPDRDKHLHIISARDAKRKGMYKFLSGKPCRNGHISERYVNSNSCVACDKERYQNNREAVIKRQTDWNNRNSERYSERQEYWRNTTTYEINKKRTERVKSYLGRDVQRGVEVELIKAYRTLKFSDKEVMSYNFNKMAEMYLKRSELSQETGVNHHVDHIIPLNGEDVSGLHVWYNLKVITGRANSMKGTTYSQEDGVDDQSWSNFIDSLDELQVSA